jgi:DNA-binding IclR family transcriptional regulator
VNLEANVKSEPKVQSLDRTFDILEILANKQNGMTLAQISEKLNLPRSTVHRLLGVLLQRAFVRKSIENNKYRLGPGFIGLCSHYLNNLELKTESTPFMSELSKTTGNTVFIAIRQNDRMVYVDSQEQFNSLRKYSIIGQQKPLYCTSLGKALLMGLTDEEIRLLLINEKYEKRGPNTHMNIESLLQDIRECRRRGWALDNQEAEPAINCVAAPIYDYRGQVIASISTFWMLTQHPEMVPEEIAVLVMKAAGNISSNMGYIGESSR